jgi:predicted transcriptional regulator
MLKTQHHDAENLAPQQEKAMSTNSHRHLSRRERQIMDIIYQRGQATAAEVQESLPDPPSYSAVRAMLRLLDEKGYLKHEQDGPRYLFKPTLAREKARKSAMKQMLETFFDGSTEQAVAALLNLSKSKLGKEELDRMSQMIETAKKEGR